MSTSTGVVIGVTYGSGAGAVSRFLGIPYAEPPVGNLRWRPPLARAAFAAPWDASHTGSPCPQGGGTSGAAGSKDEDCLFLNVWTPRAIAAARLPVIVFIHGGSFNTGSGGDALYEGATLAQKEQVVVVTLNYRLGQLGWLAHPALIAEDEHASAGNYGLLDQQLALRWVQANVAAFGGDPGNVTILGESAGAFSVCMQMASTLAEGLFQRAIGESGACLLTATPLRDDPSQPNESAESLGRKFAAALGCDGKTEVAACMRAQSVDAVLGAATVPLTLDRRTAQFVPNLDGWVLPADLQRAFRTGHFQRVPYLTGVNKDEGSLFSLAIPVVTRSDFERYVASVVPDFAVEAAALYPSSKYSDPRAALTAFLGDLGFECHARLQARLVSRFQPETYLYYFTRTQALGTLTGLGVFHATEQPYVFGNFSAPFVQSPDDDKVSTMVMGYWSRFARGGDPNGADAPAWPRSTDASEYMQLDTTPLPGTHLKRDTCDTVERWLAKP